MKTQHTPGPWRIIQEGRLITGNRPELDTPIALLNSAHALTEAESKANAALIAAAPDLLQACECLVADYRRSKSELSRQQFEFCCRSIAKAKGQS